MKLGATKSCLLLRAVWGPGPLTLAQQWYRPGAEFSKNTWHVGLCDPTRHQISSKELVNLYSPEMQGHECLPSTGFYGGKPSVESKTKSYACFSISLTSEWYLFPCCVPYGWERGGTYDVLLFFLLSSMNIFLILCYNQVLWSLTCVPLLLGKYFCM